jgi:hypothetical protein
MYIMYIHSVHCMHSCSVYIHTSCILIASAISAKHLVVAVVRCCSGTFVCLSTVSHASTADLHKLWRDSNNKLHKLTTQAAVSTAGKKNAIMKVNVKNRPFIRVVPCSSSSVSITSKHSYL